MSDPGDQGLKTLEADLADTTATVTDSDNSQSSTGAPPDITQIASSFEDENEAYCSDPPDLNPEDSDLDKIDHLPKTVSVTDTLEITDSNGPPDLTNSEDFDYGSNQEVLGIEESDFPDVIEAEACNPDTGESVNIESETFLSAHSPQDSCPFISESGTDISLAQEVSKTYQLSRFSESRYSESLLAVAPDDILPVRPGDILPVQGAQQINVHLQQQLPIKRGPGRPRKDGIEFLPKKKTKIKSSIKGIHSMSQHPSSNFSQMEVLDNSSQGSSSLGEISSEINMENFGMSEEESNCMYQLEEGVDIPLRMCSLCNLAERSLLGQGDICRYEPTPGFDPSKQTLSKLEKKFSPEPEEKDGEKGPKPLTWRRNRGPVKGIKERSKSPRRYPHNWDDDSCFVGNELSYVGFTEDFDTSQLFELSGHVWAHHCCAAWSEGVVQSCNLLLLYVDKAVFGGISQKCNYCHRFGSTIKCRIQKCDNMYHYPCAAARGCFQDIKTLTLLCPDHTDQAHAIAAEEALCVICDTVGNVLEQLFCTSCGHHYHSNCLNPVVSLTPEVRAGWQCPDCKVCQKCRKAGDDNKMLVCDTCDKGYHTYCLKPVMTTIPKNGWKCKNCRVCTDCESRTPGSGPSSRWHHNYSVCDSCYQQRNKGLFCPVCRKAYRQFTSNAMLLCTSCKKHVHRGCDENIELYMDPVLREQQPEYVCITCKNGPEMDIDLPSYSFPGPPEESNDEFMKVPSDDFIMKDPDYDISSIGDNSSQLDSNFFLNEDSVCSMDIDISVIEKGAQQLGQSSYPHPEHSTGGKGGKLSVMSRKKLAVGKTRGRPPLAEKKKRTSSFSERKRGAKPKLKTGLGSTGPLGAAITVGEAKVKDEDDEDDHPQTLIMADAEDHFVLNQDVCKSCGSFGKGEEGKLIVCTQCGQCYHPYCVGVKVTKVVLQKGWRCLDCTVCEGCGKPHDEGRLILCDECDISYHIYCLEPPLDHVPKGTWKCKWCVKCVYCGTTSPGFGCQWQNNYTQCGPCNSKICCPCCRRSYCEEELIIQCLACDRWLHALCDGLKNEDETERAADFGYNCKFCRPRTGHPGPLPPPPPPSPPTPEELRSPTPPLLPLLPPPIREPEIPKRFLMDGVYLNQPGINLIQTLMAQVPKVKRLRKKKVVEPEIVMKSQLEGQFKTPSIARMLSTQSSIDGDEELDELRMSVDSESTMTFGDTDDTLLSPIGMPTVPILGGGEPVAEEKKRRRRNVVGLGVGGFIARQRHRAPNKSKQLEGVVPEGEEVGEDGIEKTAVDPEQKQRRKRQARKKSQLENSFPSYLQEAFFGKEILDKSKLDAKQGLKIDAMSEEEQEVPFSPKIQGLGGESVLNDSGQTLKQMLPPVSITKDHKLADNEDIGNIEDNDFKDILPDDLSELHVPADEDLFSIIGPELTKDDESFEDGSDQTKSELPGNLESMLSPHNLDVEKMLSEGLAHIDGQTVEDIFKGVLQDGQEGHAKQPAEGFNEGVPGSQGPPSGNFPGHIPSFAIDPSGFGPGFSGKPGHPGFQDPRFHPEFPDHSNWPPGADGEDDESDSGNSRRKILKWECDEELGANATISAILYCNMNHIELRTQFPEWNERVKRIAKLWRALSADEKQPYLLQARKNRQNTKVTKVSNDLKKQKQKEKAAAAAASMGPPLPPGMPPGPPPFPQSSEGSPLQEMRKAVSNTQIAEGNSPVGQIPPAGVPSSPIHRVYHGNQTEPIQRRPQDPYSQQPPTPMPMDPRPPGMDPYAHQPSTPRPAELFGPSGANVRPQSIGTAVSQRGDSFSAVASDPFDQSPTGPRSGTHPGTPQQSPSNAHWLGAAQESDPFAQSPFKQIPEGLQSPTGRQVPKLPEGFSQPMVRPSLSRPNFVRQTSQGDHFVKMSPTLATSQSDDQFTFQPSTPRPVSEAYKPQGPNIGMPPHPMLRHPSMSMPPSPSGEVRPQFLQRSMSGPGMPTMPPGVENFHMQRQPFRPHMPPSTQQMVRPPIGYDPYSQQPGTPHPGIDPSREPSVLQQMFAAASRRPTLFPFSGMFSSFMHQNYVVPDKTPQGDQKQQLREILAQKTKSRQKKKEQWPDGTPGQGPFHPDERFPVPQVPGMPPWQGPPVMGPPPLHPQHMKPEMQIRMRGPFPEGMRQGVPMRQPRPGGPMQGPPGPFSPNRPIPGQVLQPGHHPQNQLEMYHQQMQQQSTQPQIPGQIPMGYRQQEIPIHPGHPGHPAQQQRMAFDPSKVQQIPPSSVGSAPEASGSEAQQKGMESRIASESQVGQIPRGAKTDMARPKLSMSSSDEKTEEHDNIDDFLDLDGSFDILKYADPELDLNIEGKTIFDDLEDEPVPDSEVKGPDEDASKQNKPKINEKGDNIKVENAQSKPESDFQSKFLEFSQKKPDDQSRSNNLSETEKSKQEINHIAALLQKSEQIGHKLERRDSQKSDGSGKDHTGPNTPSGMIDTVGSIPAQGMSVGQRQAYQTQIHSPMHQSFQAVPSPGSATGSFQQGPSTPGLVSPKIMPSPRSSAPSPKTPNALSPFSQQPSTPVVSGQQQSPFSQPTNSPFSPSVTCSQSPFNAAASTSAPQSPYGPTVSQPPYGLPPGSLQAAFGTQSSPMTSSQSPGQRSPRGTITPTNQFIQGGPYGKPSVQVSQQGASLGPSPNSMMYGQAMAGQRLPYTGVTSEGYATDVDQNMHVIQSGVRMPISTVQSTMPYQPGPDGMPRFPGQPQLRGQGVPSGFPGPGQPGMAGFPPGMRMRQPSPGMASPGVTIPTSMNPAARPSLLQEQPLLIQDLLEKEKQEQQRQAQQQAMMHRREGPVEGMISTGPQQMSVPAGMAAFRPRMMEQNVMQRHPVDPNWIGPRMFAQSPDGQPQFHARMPGQQMGQGPRLPTPFPGQGMGPQGIPPPPQPPLPPMQGEVSPEIERQHVQYEDWLMKHSQYLEMQIKALETQIAKCKRTKKAINARNRQAKKIGKELPPNDQIELERTTQEQTMLQKQLEGMRKQLRHHQMVTQDYRSKKRERFGEPQVSVQPPENQPTHLQPRIPHNGSNRLPQSVRQEYDAYMMNKLRQQQMTGQQQPPPMTAAPRPPVHIVEYDPEKSPKKSSKVPVAIIQDNNPFSEGYQEREKMVKIHPEPVLPPMSSAETGDQSDRPVPFYGDRAMSFDQSIRLPASSSGDQQRYHLQGPRFPDPALMGDQGARPPMPTGFPGPPIDQTRMVYRQAAPSYGQGPAHTQAPMEPRPPVHFTPQSETEKRIMEILESTAGLHRRQQEEKQETEKESSKPGTPGKSVAQKETKIETTSSSANTATTPSTATEPSATSVASSKNSDQVQSLASKVVQSTGSNLNLPSSAELSRESEDSQDSEPILPMNVMIHQQSMPHRVTMPQMFNAAGVPQTAVSKPESQQLSEMIQTEETSRSSSSSPRVLPQSNSPRIPTPHSSDMMRSTSGSPRILPTQDGARSTSSSPRIPQSPNQRPPPDLYRQGVPYRHPQAPDGYRSGSTSPRVLDNSLQKSATSPRVSNAPSPKDIQRTIPSPRMDPQRPGSANSDSSRTGSPRVPPSISPAGHMHFSADSQHQGIPGIQQSHFMSRTLPHPIPPRGKSPGRVSPRQSQPSPSSETQIMSQSQLLQQFPGRKSPGQGFAPNSMGRGMPQYPPSTLPVSFHNQGNAFRPGMMQHSAPNRFQQQSNFRPQFSSEQQRPLSQRYMYPYPQSVTSSLAESTLAQLPRFTAKVTSAESGASPTSQSAPALTSGNQPSAGTHTSELEQTGFNPSEPAIPGLRQDKNSLNVTESALPRSSHHIQQSYIPQSTTNIPPNSNQNVLPTAVQMSQTPMGSLQTSTTYSAMGTISHGQIPSTKVFVSSSQSVVSSSQSIEGQSNTTSSHNISHTTTSSSNECSHKEISSNSGTAESKQTSVSNTQMTVNETSQAQITSEISTSSANQTLESKDVVKEENLNPSQ
ncbi:histone-lysine N-methyltransferase 2C-like isoform X6 [Mytilus californianus]|uniref:histone-lysine N-methyltransferase 2C-like isoform X6 n=1 Tax=Mytilus californianus TaxID=6549 RepID=UPI00224809FF|nr:histone-lysine N-methyltransferase 2C-like isoform X6 [Mytilus californianus]